jgi:hypothetical protein
VEEVTDEDAIDVDRGDDRLSRARARQPDHQGVSDPRAAPGTDSAGGSRPHSGTGAITNRTRRRHTTPPAQSTVADASRCRVIT